MPPECSGYEVSASLDPIGSQTGTRPHGYYVEDMTKLESLVQQANGLCWVEDPGKYSAANAIAFLDVEIKTIWATIFVGGSGESAVVDSNDSEPVSKDKWMTDVQGTIFSHAGKSGSTTKYAYGVKNQTTYTVHIYLNPID